MPLRSGYRLLGGALAWLAGGALAAWLDAAGATASAALPVVLAAALAGLCWPPLPAALACLPAMLAFNWFLLEPRGSLRVHLPRDATLLGALLLVSCVVTLLMARQRQLAEQALRESERQRALQQLADTLRQAGDARTLGEALRAAVEQALPTPPGTAPAACTALWLAPQPLPRRPWLASLPPQADTAGDGVTPGQAGPPPAATAADGLWLGPADAEARAGLRLCAHQAQALGPHTGRHAHQPAWYLPLRAPTGTPGALRVDGHALPPAAAEAGPLRAHLQALCDLSGQALARLQAEQAARLARQEAAEQALRSTLLAAVAHDHRTPLATILGAASALAAQDERLDARQRRALATTIADEATQLSRLTDNALQLARLDAAGARAGEALRRDWESVEELVGAVLRRVRARDPQRRVQARLIAPLPLLHADAVLLVQLLENLIDNALAHSPPGQTVEVLAARQGPQLLLAVRDRGPGFAPGSFERLLGAFERGPSPAGRSPGPAPAAAHPDRAERARRGAGLGLALCLAVARAHGGTLRQRARRGGGSAVELRLPLTDPPAAPEEDSPA